ncbi:unnamed protein product, partial [Didymodactylos carnosus]
YFPIHLHKTCDLSPDRSYIFGYHPHGIISLGAFCNFATEATDFEHEFPGINLRLLTLTSNFRIPFYELYIIDGCIGRGVFQYAIGFLPNRHRIYTYVGEPIQLPKLERNQITPDIVDQYHKQYMNALTRLFDRYKSEHDQSDATIIYANDDVSSL